MTVYSLQNIPHKLHPLLTVNCYLYTVLMLSVFPEILFLSPLAATLLRLALAAVFARAAWVHAQRGDTASRTLAFAEVAVALALLLGAWTQPAALAGAIIAAVWIFQRAARATPFSSALLALAISLSLVLTGPGAFAFDLPL